MANYPIDRLSKLISGFGSQTMKFKNIAMRHMKHIKRKTVLGFKLDETTMQQIAPGNIDPDALSNIKYKDVKKSNALQIMEDGEVVLSFFYDDNGIACTIPLANPVLIYFNMAQSSLKNIYSTRQDLLGLFHNKKDINEDALKLFYGFFGLTSSFVTMLMNSIEAFVNQQIDKDYLYEAPEQNRYTKMYNYEQILRWVSLDDKIQNILNKKYARNFAVHYPNRNVFIKNLTQLRNQIVHTKSGNGHEGYIELYRASLNFKFIDSLEAVRDFINYYEPNLIEPCPCNIPD